MRGVEGIEPDVYVTDPTTGGCSDTFQRRVRALVTDELAHFAAGLHLPGGEDVTATASGALSRTASNLMSHVEAV
jgi:hypothetical protein